MKPEREFRNKLIAFIDILGFKTKVEAAERGAGVGLDGLLEQCSRLAQESHRTSVLLHGPLICPDSQRVQRSLDYAVTQVSDCAVISCEVSPAGAVNLLHHVRSAAAGLLRDGSMVRGYVCMGSIYHQDGGQFVGTGYQRAFELERRVGAFRPPADGFGTPFVEIDPAVVEYVRDGTDPCVQRMFDRMTTTDSAGITVVDPMKQLSAIAGSGPDRAQVERNAIVVAGWIEGFLASLESQSPERRPHANVKAKHYRRFLNDQLRKCRRMLGGRGGLANRP